MSLASMFAALESHNLQNEIISRRNCNSPVIEFDGETVLCRVCGDKASGFHYGVHACEGCKGFFRRSIQQKIQYRPCLKNQQCNIMRVNRNRCQYCRLKKCISVGMSRDAVRFGRVPKKEKARIMEQMQKVNSQASTSVLSEVLENESELVHTVVSSHKLTNEFTRERVQQLREEAFRRNDFMTCPAHMACPLNINATTDTNDNKQRWEEFSEYFTPAIKCVVDFAKFVPGFQMLSQDDQVTLLKAGTFEVLLLRFVSLFDPTTNTMLFTNGKLFRRQQTSASGSAGFLLDSMFDFADRFSKLNLSEDELALFSAIILLAPDRPGLRNIEQVERIQNKLTQALQNMINSIHMDDSTLFAKLLMKTTDLRTLNTLHSEKLIGPQSKDAEKLANPMFNVKQEHIPMDTETSSNEMLLNFGSPPSGAPLPLPGRPGIDIPMATPAVPVIPPRVPMEGNSHQKLVLQTPYGTFYREEVSGFYGYLPDQPRQRCHTLDRETMSRPSRSLHVIDEGNRRRYTLDKEYISKMVNKLSHKLEKRAVVNDDYNPPSVSSSVCSSPTPDDQYSRLAMGNTSESGTSSSRTSPIPGKDRYSPSSPNPRSRSGSMAEKDYEIRRRCYSFHLNSEGRAARNLHPTAVPLDSERFLHDQIQPPYSADARRGSVGASYGLHRHEKALLMERGATHLLQSPEAFYRGVGKRPGKVGLDDSVKFQRVQPCVGLSTPTLSAQLAASPLDKAHSPPTRVTPPKSDVSKLSWCSPDASRGIENVSPPTSENPKVSDSTATPSAKIVVSDFSTGLVHKKFDKFRKTSPQPTQPPAQEREKSVEVLETSVSVSSTESQPALETEKLSKPSAAEAHPQLMAHLKSPPSAAATQVSKTGIPATLSTEPRVVMTAANHKPVSVSSTDIVSNGHKPLSEEEEKNIRDHVHATTMLSLKDKLLKKIDSMDNLTKISSGNRDITPSASPARDAVRMPTSTQTTAILTSQPPPHTMYAPSPVYSPQIQMYPAYYPLRYPGVAPGIPLLPQGGYPQPVPSMPHLAQMYPGPMPPHLRPSGQPLNLSKSLEDLPKGNIQGPVMFGGRPLGNNRAPVVSTEKPAALGSPQRSVSEEMVVS